MQPRVQRLRVGQLRKDRADEDPPHLDYLSDAPAMGM
jgi:hypothetical protein